MGTSRRLLRARAVAAVCTAGALAAVWACRDPTEVTLNITTDVGCDTILGLGDAGTATGVKIVVGSNGGDLDNKSQSPVAQTTTQCQAGLQGPHVENPIGTFVIVPDQGAGSSEQFAVMVVLGVEKPADKCFYPDYSGCIVARRELSFVPHTQLTLPIALDRDCLNVSCGPDQTCFQKTCQTANTHCQDGTCLLPPAGDAGGTSSDDGPDETTTGDDAGPDHQAVDSTADVGPDVSSPDAPEDTTVDTAPGMDVTSEGPGPSTDAPPDVTEASASGGSSSGGSSSGSSSSGSASSSGSSSGSASSSGSSSGSSSSGSASSSGSSSGSSSSGGSSSGGASDAGVIGPTCIAAGTSSVACNGGACTGGQVCKVLYDGTLVNTSEACVSSCTPGYNTITTQYTSCLACRNQGDCPSGDVCCGAPVNSGVSATCVAPGSCPVMISGQRPLCHNSCECGALTCSAKTCPNTGSEVFGTCGGICP